MQRRRKGVKYDDRHSEEEEDDPPTSANEISAEEEKPLDSIPLILGDWEDLYNEDEELQVMLSPKNSVISPRSLHQSNFVTKKASFVIKENWEDKTDSEEETDNLQILGNEKDGQNFVNGTEKFEKREENLKNHAHQIFDEKFGKLRSPIICIMGHVDTGKTKLLDMIRRTDVQGGEAGGITQQIGATFFPQETLELQTDKVSNGKLSVELPGLLIIDTPGHESFSNLRNRGSSLCDLAIVVVDIMHELEPQTRESLNMLKSKKVPFVIALNKVDRLYNWKKPTNSNNSKKKGVENGAVGYKAIKQSFKNQPKNTMSEFEDRYKKVVLQLNEMGFNCDLYFDNKDSRKVVNIIPTSAITGEGIPDLLFVLTKLSQSLMKEKLTLKRELQCTVLEVKETEGYGVTVDVLLVNGILKEKDTIVLAGLNGPIVTQIRALLSPPPCKEMRVKCKYEHHNSLCGAMGVKISANNLENAIAGVSVHVLSAPENQKELENLKILAKDEFESAFIKFEKAPEGVYVMASTLGSLEALLEFLKTSEIPVNQVAIGEVHEKDVKKASIMIERKKPEFAVILSFDVKITNEAKEEAKKLGVKIFSADIIYHLFDQFTDYMKKFRESQKNACKDKAVFPVVLKIIPEFVFNTKQPIIVGVKVTEGVLKLNTPLCIPDKGNLPLGKIISMEKDKKQVEKAVVGDAVSVKIDCADFNPSIMFGRHFDHTNDLVSLISRESIDVLKEFYKSEMRQEDWRLIVKLKNLLKIP